MKTILLPLTLFLSLTALAPSLSAGSATWNSSPTSGDWNTATNWMPATVPNGPTDVATFSVSNITALRFSAAMTEVAAIVFSPGASSFNITADSQLAHTDVTLSISGTGISNDSGVTQNFTIGPSVVGASGSLKFLNAATAGESTAFSVLGSISNGAFGGGFVEFNNASTAGVSSIVVGGALAGDEAYGGEVDFRDNASAGDASFTVDGAEHSDGSGGQVFFFDSSSASEAAFVVNASTVSLFGGGSVIFHNEATAANGVFTLNGSTAQGGTGPDVTFFDGTTAANGFFTVNGSQTPGNSPSGVTFQGFTFTGLIASAGTATFINNGGNGSNMLGGFTSFTTATAASQSRLIANGGVNGGLGGKIAFSGEGDGGESNIEVYGNGYLEISSRSSPGVTIGSLAGDGLVNLGSRRLTVGSNDRSTAFSGTIQDRGSLMKIGTGRLILASNNTYAGGTTLETGTLLVTNAIGTATGSGAVQVNGGRLGGGGIIAGAVTIGTGSGTGAFLAPAAGSKTPVTFTTSSSLTLNVDATYICTLKAKPSRSESDTLVANGVTISGAIFSLRAKVTGTLPAGTVFTTISNTSVNPLSGVFSNLPDGAILSVNGNNLQANYEGGDGNDLTLTVL